MTKETKEEKMFLDLLDQGLVELASRPAKHLGDRSTYLGGSDQTCGFATAMSRISPKPFPPKTCLIFQRGHGAEDIVDEVLKVKGFTPEREVRVKHKTKNYFQANLDFLFSSETRKTKKYLELKTTSHIPDEPYSGHPEQLAWGIGLLAMNNPGWKIEGGILYLNMNTGEKRFFGGYTSDSVQGLFEVCMEKSQVVWDFLQGKGPQPPATTSIFKCDYCRYKPECPAQQLEKREIPPDVVNLAKEYLNLNEQIKASNKRKEEVKEMLKDYVGESFSGISAEGGFSLVTTTVAESLLVDGNKLKRLYPDVYKEVTKPKAGFTKLDVKPLVAE